MDEVFSRLILSCVSAFPYKVLVEQSDTRVIAAKSIVHVVDEGVFLAVLKQNPQEAKTSGQTGVFFFYYLPDAPAGKMQMPYLTPCF